MSAVGAVERCEGQIGGRLDDWLGLAVQSEYAALAVSRAQLLARHRDLAVGAVAHEHRVGAGSDEYPVVLLTLLLLLSVVIFRCLLLALFIVLVVGELGF